MNKFGRKILLLSICFIIAFVTVFSGCDFVSMVKPSENETENSENIDYTYNKITVTSSLTDSTTLTNNVAFKYNSSTATMYDYVQDAISNTRVNRASVAIKVVLDNAVYAGSGTIVDIDDGVNYGANEGKIFYVLTCHHVIAKCEGVNNSISVYVPDAEGDNGDDISYNTAYKFTGKIGGEVSLTSPVCLVGGDKETDVAVLRLFVSNPTVANNIVKAKVLNENSTAKLGEEVFAIGNAQGEHFGWTTKGVVSDTSTVQYFDGIGDLNLLGINADIYPGNSGGGLFNMKGELIGITNGGETISVDGQDTSIGINFALPHKTSAIVKSDTGFINIAKQLIGTFVKSNGNNYGYISYHREKLGFTSTETNGTLIVSAIMEGSQAQALMKVGDIIKTGKKNSGTEITLTSNTELTALLSSANYGDKIYIKISRNSHLFTCEFTVSQAYFCNTGNYANIIAS